MGLRPLQQWEEWIEWGEVCDSESKEKSSLIFIGPTKWWLLEDICPQK